MTEKRTSGRQVISRRRALEIGIPGVTAFALGAVQSPASAKASPASGASSILISALRSLGTDVCDAAARNLEATEASNAPFSLHLRNAGLTVSDAEVLAKALRSYSSENFRMLQSFSVSYNPFLGDHGTAALAQSLPQSVSEVGFVGCDIGDSGGQALLKWARQAPRLSMICVEDNRFSQSTKMGFRDLGTERAGLLVVV